MLIPKEESLCGNSWGESAKYRRGILMQKYQQAAISLVCFSVSQVQMEKSANDIC